MKVWVYTSRNGNDHVYTGTRGGWLKARAEQDDDNNATVEEILLQGEFEVGGSYMLGYFTIDDGGSIKLFEVE